MIKKLRKDPILWGIICISLVCLSVLLWNRHQVEQANKEVHFSLDYQEIELLAEQSEWTTEEWLQKFKEWGCGSVAIQEESIKSLAKEGKNLTSRIVLEIKETIDWKDHYPETLVEKIRNHTYRDDQLVIISEDSALSEFLKRGMKARYPADFYDLYEDGDKLFVVVKTDFDQLLYTSTLKAVNANTKEVAEIRDVYENQFEEAGVGFDPEKIKTAKAAGLKIIPRPANYNKHPEMLVKAFIQDVEAYDMEPEAMIFGGRELVGQPTQGNELYEYMKENKISVALIETPVQRSHIAQEGIDELTEALDYDAVRLFSVANYIQKRYKFYNYDGSEEIENTLYRAITERNIRLIYFKPFKWNDALYVTDTEEYERMFVTLEKRLAEHHITIGDFTIMNVDKPSWVLIGISALGLVSMSLLWLMQFVALPTKWKYALLGVGSAGVFGGLFIAPNTMAKVLALYAAILMPSIAATMVIFGLRHALLEKHEASFGEIVGASVKNAVLPIMIATLGGLYVGGILSDSKYLLEMDIFRGVKLSQLMPLVIAVAVYILVFGYRRKREMMAEKGLYFKDLKRIMMEDIKIYYILLAGVVGIVGYIYIARTGHETNIEPSDLEMIVRNFLEVELLARPRTKEFLLAFPALVMIYSFAKQRVKLFLFPALLVVTIGLTSVANTFSHLRTPLYLSIVRTLYSFGFGIIIGVIGTVVFYLCLKIYQTYFEKWVLKWTEL